MGEPDIKHLPISEFRDRGYLHEVNRLLLHPLGLALEVRVSMDAGRVIMLTEKAVENLQGLLDAALSHGLLSESDRTDLMDQLDRAQRLEAGEAILGRVWDCQDDPEGITYGEDLLSAEKAAGVCMELLERRDERRKHTGGWVIQPIPDRQVLSTTYTDPTLRVQGGDPVEVVETGLFKGVGELPEDPS